MLDRMSISNFRKLGDSLAVLVVAPAENLEDNTTDILKEVLKKGVSCLYIAVNQPYKRMLQLLEKKGIDTKKVFFIDCITKESGGKPVENDNVYYISSASNLTELDISIKEGLESIDGKKIMFFDALSTMLIYSRPGPFAKFAHSVMTKIKSMGIRGIFIAVEGEIEEEMLSKMEQFSDTTISLV